MLETLPEAWREHLAKGFPPTDRLYIDPRGREYPHLPDSAGAPQFTRVRDNLIDRGNCESATAPGILGETGSTSNATFARSDDFAHGGTYSYKFTKTIAAGTLATFRLTDGTAVGDMHGFVAGEAYEKSIWVYIPTASGIDPSEVALNLRYGSGGGFSTLDVTTATTLDTWEELTISGTIPSDTTEAFCQVYAASTAALNEYFYVDDIRLTAHTCPGSHYLSSGYIETLCPMSDKFSLRLRFLATFAYNVATPQELCGKYIAWNRLWHIRYEPAQDKFYFYWQDGGTIRYLVSAQYDNGSAHRNINQIITLDLAFDPSAGQTGSSLWLNKTQDDADFGGAPDAKVTEFNTMQLRAYNGSAGAYNFFEAIFIPDYMITDDDVQDDFKNVTAEQIYWDLNGHSVGRTRCNVTPFVQRIATLQEQQNEMSGAYGANTIDALLINRQHRQNLGLFSDDQYAEFDPESYQYNGTSAQAYLRRNMNVWLETWYDGDHDTVFFGQMSAPMTRVTGGDGVGHVAFHAEDIVARIAKYAFRRGRFYDGYAFARGTNMFDYGSCEWSNPPTPAGETTVYLSNATFNRSDEASYKGRYCRKFVKTVAAGTVGQVLLQDTGYVTTDMHNCIAGKTYTFKAKFKVPTASGIAPSEIHFRFGEYYSAAWHYTAVAPTKYDVWEQLAISNYTLNAGTTGVVFVIYTDATPAINEYFYVSEIELFCTDDQSQNEQTSLMHEYVRAATQADIKQYIANNFFSDATISNSWININLTSLSRSSAEAIFGSYSMEMVYDVVTGGNQYADQIINFDGIDRLNVGQTFTYSVLLLCASAAASAIYIREEIAATGASPDSTSKTYSLSGGEGFKLVSVTHTITDQTSDRLRVRVRLDDNVTMYVGAASLTRTKEAISVFKENTNNGSSGECSADDADTINYDRCGLWIDAFTLVHPFRRINKGESMWEHIKAMSESGLVEYVGAMACGTFQFKPRLGDTYEEAVPTNLIPTNPQSINTEVITAALNKLIMHGVIIKKHDFFTCLWYLSGTGFYEVQDSGLLAIEVANGETVPDAEEFGNELIARYGETQMPQISPYMIQTFAETDVGQQLIEWAQISPWQMIFNMATSLLGF